VRSTISRGTYQPIQNHFTVCVFFGCNQKQYHCNVSLRVLLRSNWTLQQCASISGSGAEYHCNDFSPRPMGPVHKREHFVSITPKYIIQQQRIVLAREQVIAKSFASNNRNLINITYMTTWWNNLSIWSEFMIHYVVQLDIWLVFLRKKIFYTIIKFLNQMTLIIHLIVLEKCKLYVKSIFYA
jgi:hypothetical protein